MNAKEELIYTPRFFAELKEKIDKRPHKCKGCGVADGDKRVNRDYSKQRFGAVVRLCVDDATKPSNQSRNIEMFCTRCRKPNQEWRTPRRIKPNLLPQLFNGTSA